MNIIELRNIYYHAINAGFGLESYDSQTTTVNVFFRENYQLSIAQASRFFSDLDALHNEFPLVPYGVLTTVAGYLIISDDNHS